MYVAGQSVVYRIVKLNNEQESGIANMFETVLMNFKCDQTNLIQNITEYYNTVKVKCSIELYIYIIIKNNTNNCTIFP